MNGVWPNCPCCPNCWPVWAILWCLKLLRSKIGTHLYWSWKDFWVFLEASGATFRQTSAFLREKGLNGPRWSWVGNEVPDIEFLNLGEKFLFRLCLLDWLKEWFNEFVFLKFLHLNYYNFSWEGQPTELYNISKHHVEWRSQILPFPWQNQLSASALIHRMSFHSLSQLEAQSSSVYQAVPPSLQRTHAHLSYLPQEHLSSVCIHLLPEPRNQMSVGRHNLIAWIVEPFVVGSFVVLDPAEVVAIARATRVSLEKGLEVDRGDWE